MKTRFTIVALLLSFAARGLFAQIPLVYTTENTGAGCAAPPLPAFSQLPTVEPLTDPFMWSDNRGRSTSFSDWECRRNEIKAEVENYEIGTKPTRPQNITASYAAGVLTVNVTENGQTLTLTSQISLPTGSGPFPAIIGMNSLSGSVPATVFTSRNVARITFNHNQVTTYGGQRTTDPYYRLYPNFTVDNMGQYSAWAWGVSRLIDGLELVQASLPIDLQHIGVTGCSYAGKMALFSGALDERIALTIAQESGGGGAPAWRVSETIGAVEKLGATDYNWFKEDMRQFSGVNVAKLPHDHHELMAMIAPRALLVTANTDFEWLANPSAYVSARAAHEVWKAFGIGDRFGFYIDGGHNHCAIPATQVTAVEAFVEKFLLGNTATNTNITEHPYPLINYQRWYQWWGTGNPILPPLPPEPLGKRLWLEAECATVGANWEVVADTAASNGTYVQVKSGSSSPTTAPTDASAYLVLPFTTDSAATYNVRARLNVPLGEDYSYWMKLDDGNFETISNQLARNPGFESGLSGWPVLNASGATVSANTVATEAHTGSGSMKVVNPTAQPGSQWRVQVSSAAFPTTIGKQYVISYWVRAAAADGSIRLSTGPSSAQYQGNQAIGTAWQQVSWTITATLASTTFLFDMGQVANTYYIDDVSVKEVGSVGWQWVKIKDAVLSAGPHTVTIGYGEGSAKLDKLLITTSSATITGKGAAATNCNVVLPTTGGFRLNAGGPAMSASLGQFVADQYFSTARSAVATTAAPIAGTTDDALYQSERYSTDGQLRYALPVANGTYSVVLHFAETYWTQPGQRVFNIGLEGNTVRTNYDIVAKVGPLTATTETFSVAVTDGVLNLDLLVPYLNGGADQAKLSALEIMPASAAYRLNTGGGTQMTARGEFVADQYFSAASAVATTTATIAGTTDDALYQSERYSTDGQLRYALPVANGTYSVVLHFAETYWTQPGQRVFNIGLEGNTVRTNYDIVAKVGPLTATTETFSVAVTDGVLNLDLLVPYLNGGADQAKLSALEIIPSTGSRGALATNAKTGAGLVQNLSVYPNPTATGRFTLTYSAVQAQAGTLTLVDQLGRTVHEQVVYVQTGPNHLTVEPAQVRAGLYQLVLRTADGQRLSQKLLVQP